MPQARVDGGGSSCGIEAGAEEGGEAGGDRRRAFEKPKSVEPGESWPRWVSSLTMPTSKNQNRGAWITRRLARFVHAGTQVAMSVSTRISK